jgi:hypothetical protein
MLTDIIGKKFRRNKYGLSTWEDTIKEIHYSLSVNASLTPKFDKSTGKMYDMFTRLKLDRLRGKKHGYKVVPKVVGYNSLTSYDLDEIIIWL